ncbi:MAG: YwiC-like family protein [Nitrospinota bacterium]
MKFPSPVWPKEHGLWVWVLLPLCVGAGSARGGAGNVWFVSAAVIFWFLALTPARMVYKNFKKKMAATRAAWTWSLIYASMGAAAAALSVWTDFRVAAFYVVLGPSFYLGVRAAHAGFQKSALFEFGGIVYLSLLSLVGGFSVAGDIKKVHFAVLCFVLIFLLDRSIQTRIIARTVGRKGEFSEDTLKTVCRMNIFSSFASLAAVSVVLTVFALPRVFWLAYLPGMAVTLMRYIKPPRSLRQVGYFELGLAIIFTAFFIFLSKNLYV